VKTAKRRPRRSHFERGAAAVELALVLPMVLLLMGGIIDWGRFMFSQAVATNAAREGARALSLGYVLGPAGTAGTAKSRVANSTFGMQGTPSTTYYKVAGGTATAISSDTDTACSSSPVIGDSARVTIVINNFTWIMLDPAMRLLGGSISVKPNAQAEVGCTGS